jgi:hypothetical protein
VRRGHLGKRRLPKRVTEHGADDGARADRPHAFEQGASGRPSGTQELLAGRCLDHDVTGPCVRVSQQGCGEANEPPAGDDVRFRYPGARRNPGCRDGGLDWLLWTPTEQHAAEMVDIVVEAHRLGSQLLAVGKVVSTRERGWPATSACSPSGAPARA